MRARNWPRVLATDRVIPVAHGTDFDALRDVSPLLGARSGLTTGAALSLDEAAKKIAAATAADSRLTEADDACGGWAIRVRLEWPCEVERCAVSGGIAGAARSRARTRVGRRAQRVTSPGVVCEFVAV